MARKRSGRNTASKKPETIRATTNEDCKKVHSDLQISVKDNNELVSVSNKISKLNFIILEKMKSVELENEKLKNEKLDLENQLGVLKNNFEALTDFLDKQNTIFENEREKFSKENFDLKRQNDLLQSSLDNLESQNFLLKNENGTLKNENSELNEKMDILNNSNISFENNNCDFKAKFDKLNTELTKFNKGQNDLNMILSSSRPLHDKSGL